MTEREKAEITRRAMQDAAAEFYRDLFPDWKLGKGLNEAIKNQQENKNG